MDPIRSKFAGTCARTGKAYKPGDLVVKTTKGWALAQDRAGNIKAPPNWRTIVLPDGAEQTYNVNILPACSVCIQADGVQTEARGGSLDLAPYLMSREGDDFVHARCDRRMHILTDQEIAVRKTQADAQEAARYQADMEANLHLRPVMYGWYELSHRLPRALWDRVAEHFAYWSHDDLDQMDYFDMPGGYYLLGDPAPAGVFLNGAPTSSPTRAALVEEALNIRPENRLAVLIPKWERQEQERQERELLRKQRQEQFDALFDCPFFADASPLSDEARNWEKIEIKERAAGANCLYLEPDGQHIWRYISGWADMSWYKCGRFPLTAERQEALQWAKEGWIQ